MLTLSGKIRVTAFPEVPAIVWVSCVTLERRRLAPCAVSDVAFRSTSGPGFRSTSPCVGRDSALRRRKRSKMTSSGLEQGLPPSRCGEWRPARPPLNVPIAARYEARATPPGPIVGQKPSTSAPNYITISLHFPNQEEANWTVLW